MRLRDFSKKVTKIIITTTQDHQNDLDAMMKFFKSNATEVAGMIKDGEDAVQKVHPSCPRLGKKMFFHDEAPKQD